MKDLLKLSTSIFALFFATTAFGQLETTPSESQFSEPGADATALYRYITRYNPYNSWNLWPGKGKFYRGTEPHGTLLTTYVNQPAYFSARGKKVMAEGSMIVKENYTADKKFSALSVMYKIPGYNPSAGDWFWASYDAYGKVLSSGKAEACINCHKQRQDNDYNFTGEVRK